MGLRTMPYWAEHETAARHPRFSGQATFDVAVVGAGITGITTALLLKRAGRKVALLDMQRVVSAQTGHTTAHLTQLIDHRYHLIEHRFGLEGARLVARSQRDAIEQIAALVAEHRLECGFRRVPAYLYTENALHVEADLHREHDAGKRAGLPVSLTTEVPLPYPVKAALRLEDQAQLHPRAYLLPLVERLVGDGSQVFENTLVTAAHDGSPCRVETQDGVITAQQVVMATDAPSLNKVFLTTKVAPYRSYAIAVRLRKPLPYGLYWDTEDPYHYLRMHEAVSGHLCIVGGEDHKVGQDDAEAAFERLEAWTRSRLDVVSLEYRWSGQILEPSDGLAYIGRNSASRNIYVGTGYSGTGITWGTLAGMILSDLILGRPNPYAELYSATRIKPLAQAKAYLSENVDYPYHLLKDRLAPGDVASIEEVPRGEGRIVRTGFKRLACFRDERGEVTTLSPVCTHMGCHVAWNGAEKSWDCPCHGGRYDARGRVITGPARRDLKPVEP